MHSFSSESKRNGILERDQYGLKWAEKTQGSRGDLGWTLETI